MRRVVLVWLLAAASLWLVGAAARWAPRGWLPEPGLLASLGLGLHVPGLAGGLGAWVVGWTTDAMSVGPRGQHALLDLAVWSLVRAAQRRVDLERALVLAPFVVALVLLQTAGLWALSAVPAPRPETLGVLVPFALVNAVAALALRPVFGALLARPEAGDPARGAIRLDAGAGLR